MASSQRRIEANRRNARLSTGPRTAEGKARSRMNALRRGGRARALLPGAEDGAEYRRYRRAMMRELAPCGLVERCLAERVVFCGWQLQRVHQMEARLIDRDLTEAAAGAGGGPADSAAVGVALARSLSGPGSPYDTLGRWERRLARSYRTALEELAHCQAYRRAGRIAPAGPAGTAGTAGAAGACPQREKSPTNPRGSAAQDGRFPTGKTGESAMAAVSAQAR